MTQLRPVGAVDSRPGGSWVATVELNVVAEPVIDPVQPIRSATTVAGISNCSASNWRTSGSNGLNDVGSRAAPEFGHLGPFGSASGL
jgi:hypothetical protein